MQFDSPFDDLDFEALAALEREYAALKPVECEPDPSLRGEEWREELPPATDLQRCTHFLEPLITKYEDSSATEWELSPLSWIRQVSSAHKRGKIGEELFVAWAKSEGLDVMGRRHRGHDCVIHGLKIEVKTSLRWNNDRFVFFGLQHDFDYDAIALVAIEPHDVRLWIASKSLILHHARSQLRGAEALGTKWLSFAAAKPPLWLSTCGGSLTNALATLTDLITDSGHQSATADPSASLAAAAEWRELAGEIHWPWQSDSHDRPCDPAPMHYQLRQPHASSTPNSNQRSNSYAND